MSGKVGLFSDEEEDMAEQMTPYLQLTHIWSLFLGPSSSLPPPSLPTTFFFSSSSSFLFCCSSYTYGFTYVSFTVPLVRNPPTNVSVVPGTRHRPDYSVVESPPSLLHLAVFDV